MSNPMIAIPGSLYDRVKQLAEEQQVSVDQFVASAIAEKMAAVEKDGYLAVRAKRADQTRLREALSHIPDTAPAEYDAL